jgi:hypothetical protein
MMHKFYSNGDYYGIRVQAHTDLMCEATIRYSDYRIQHSKALNLSSAVHGYG